MSEAPGVVAPTVPVISPAPVNKVVGHAYIFSPDLALVAVDPGPQGGPGPRLLAGTVAGDRFRDIGPATAADTALDSIFFLDPDHGWFTTFDCAKASETLYRSTNGGRSWQSFPAPGHSCGAGSTDALQFTTPQNGWLTDLQPTGPSETLYHTSDGGTTWRPVADWPGKPGGRGPLPDFGVVKFDATGATGWLAGKTLEFTRDQALSWQQVGIPLTSRDSLYPPAIFGTTLITPVVRCAANATQLRTWRSADAGMSWSLSSATNLAPGCQQPSAAFPTLTAGWVATLSNGQVAVERTIDGGQHWTTMSTPKLSTGYQPTILASDANHAWLLYTSVNRVYRTEDGGATWHRIDQHIVV